MPNGRRPSNWVNPRNPNRPPLPEDDSPPDFGGPGENMGGSPTDPGGGYRGNGSGGGDGDDDKLKELDEYIKKFLNYEVPQEVIDQQLNAFAQGITAKQWETTRQSRFADYARTGGRMGFARRGEQISDAFSQQRMAGQQGILDEAANKKLQARMIGLNAYLSKYGSDKGYASAMNQMKFDLDQRNASAWQSIFTSAASIPFMFDWGGNTGVGGGSPTDYSYMNNTYGASPNNPGRDGMLPMF